jgi:hypothetical protein
MKTPLSLLKDVATRLSAGKAAVHDLHTADADLRAAHSALLAERDQLINRSPAAPGRRIPRFAVSPPSIDLTQSVA